MSSMQRHLPHQTQMKPLLTDRDHAEALARIEAIFSAKPGTAEFDELAELATLVDAYEREHHPMSNLQAARDMEADCSLGAGAGPGKYTREVAERRRKVPRCPRCDCTETCQKLPDGRWWCSACGWLSS